MAATPPICDFGWKAPDFALPDTEGTIRRLADPRGESGTLVVFICIVRARRCGRPGPG